MARNAMDRAPMARFACRCAPPPRSGAARQKIQRSPVAFPAAICVQRLREQPLLRRGGVEQGHRRGEFQIVRKAENFVQSAPLDRQNRRDAFDQPRPRTGCARKARASSSEWSA